MGLRASEWAAYLPLNMCSRASTRAVLSILAVRGTDPGYDAYPSITTMQDALGVTRRTIQRALAELVAAGLIRSGDQSAVSHYRADRRPVVYDVLTDRLKELEHAHGEQAARAHARRDFKDAEKERAARMARATRTPQIGTA